jgi:hypothetical protein
MNITKRDLLMAGWQNVQGTLAGNFWWHPSRDIGERSFAQAAKLLKERGTDIWGEMNSTDEQPQ